MNVNKCNSFFLGRALPSGASIIKLFTHSIKSILLKARLSVTVDHILKYLPARSCMDLFYLLSLAFLLRKRQGTLSEGKDSIQVYPLSVHNMLTPCPFAVRLTGLLHGYTGYFTLNLTSLFHRHLWNFTLCFTSLFHGHTWKFSLNLTSLFHGHQWYFTLTL